MQIAALGRRIVAEPSQCVLLRVCWVWSSLIILQPILQPIKVTTFQNRRETVLLI